MLMFCPGERNQLVPTTAISCNQHFKCLQFRTNSIFISTSTSSGKNKVEIINSNLVIIWIVCCTWTCWRSVRQTCYIYHWTKGQSKMERCPMVRPKGGVARKSGFPDLPLLLYPLSLIEQLDNLYYFCDIVINIMIIMPVISCLRCGSSRPNNVSGRESWASHHCRRHKHPSWWWRW